MKIGDLKQCIISNRRVMKVQRVYILKNASTGLFKIGVSCDINRRIKSLSHSCGAELELVCSGDSFSARSCEYLMHDWFRDSRVKGEWFSLNENQLKEAVSFIEIAQRVQAGKIG